MLYTLNLHNCMLCLVAQLCLTLWPHELCSPPGSSIHWIFWARLLEWVAMPSSRGSSQPKDRTQVSHIAGRFFTIWASKEAQTYVNYISNTHTHTHTHTTRAKTPWTKKKQPFRGTILISQIRSLAFSSPLELLVSSHFPILSWSKERCFSPRGEECQANTLPALGILNEWKDKSVCFFSFANSRIVPFARFSFVGTSFLKLGDNCFTMLCWFLLYNNMNQLYVYTYSLPIE